MEVTTSHQMIKAPEDWSVEEWERHFAVLFSFLCADRMNEVCQICQMSPEKVIETVESLFVAMVTMRRGREFNRDSAFECRKSILSAIKGMDKYSESIQLSEIIPFNKKTDLH